MSRQMKDKISRSAVVAIGIGLAALAAGVVLGYYGSDNRPAAGFKCEEILDYAAGPAYIITPTVTSVAEGPQTVVDEVVCYAPAPRLVMAEVVAFAPRPEPTVN